MATTRNEPLSDARLAAMRAAGNAITGPRDDHETEREIDTNAVVELAWAQRYMDDLLAEVERLHEERAALLSVVRAVATLRYIPLFNPRRERFRSGD